MINLAIWLWKFKVDSLYRVLAMRSTSIVLSVYEFSFRSFLFLCRGRRNRLTILMSFGLRDVIRDKGLNN